MKLPNKIQQGIATALLLNTLLFPTHATQKQITYADQDSITNAQAVTLVSAVGLMVGDNNGNFNPQVAVTRAEMAVICTTLLYGDNFSVNSFSSFQLFDDLPNWAIGYINAAAAEGIVIGTGDRTFSPDQTVTAGEAMLMFLKTLGYFQNPDEFGNDWQAATYYKAQSVGLYQPNLDGRLDQFTPLTRELVAQMAFHALTSVTPVTYNASTGAYFPTGGSMYQHSD